MLKTQITLLLVLTIIFSSHCYGATQTLFEEWTGELTDSIVFLEEEVKKQPDNYKLRFVLGSLYFEVGIVKVDESTKKLSQANLLMLEKSEKEFREVLKIKKDESRAYYYLGHIMMQKEGNSDKAIEYYKKTIDYDKLNFKAYMKLHFLYFGRKEYDKAISLLEGSKQNFISNPEFYYRLSISYLAVKNYEKVVKSAKTGLSVGGGIETQLILASAYSMTQDYDNAKIVLGEILNKDEKNKSALLGLAMILNKTNKKDEALKILNKALGYYPDDVEVKNRLRE